MILIINNDHSTRNRYYVKTSAIIMETTTIKFAIKRKGRGYNESRINWQCLCNERGIRQMYNLFVPLLSACIEKPLVGQTSDKNTYSYRERSIGLVTWAKLNIHISPLLLLSLPFRGVVDIAVFPSFTEHQRFSLAHCAYSLINLQGVIVLGRIGMPDLSVWLQRAQQYGRILCFGLCV